MSAKLLHACGVSAVAGYNLRCALRYGRRVCGHVTSDKFRHPHGLGAMHRALHAVRSGCEPGMFVAPQAMKQRTGSDMTNTKYDGLVLRVQGPSRAQVFEDVGRIFVVDCVLGNADRLPCSDLGWRGNPSNIMVGALGAGQAKMNTVVVFWQVFWHVAEVS